MLPNLEGPTFYMSCKNSLLNRALNFSYTNQMIKIEGGGGGGGGEDQIFQGGPSISPGKKGGPILVPLDHFFVPGGGGGTILRGTNCYVTEPIYICIYTTKKTSTRID